MTKIEEWIAASIANAERAAAVIRTRPDEHPITPNDVDETAEILNSEGLEQR